MSEYVKAHLNPDTGKMEYKAIGSTIKALDGNRVSGYLVRFTNADDTDLHGEYFDKSTNFWLKEHSPIGKPIMIDHAFDDKFKSVPVGIIDFAKEDEIGIWIEGKLKDRKEYEDMLQGWKDRKYIDIDANLITKAANGIQQAVKTFFSTGKAQWSSGALPQSVEVDEQTGHIKSWAFIEGTGVYTPAEPDGTQIQIKSFLELLSNQLTDSPTGRKDATEHKGDDGASADNEPAQANVQSNNDNHLSIKGQSKMDENEEVQKAENPAEALAGIAEQLMAIAQSMGMSGDDAMAMANEVEDEIKAETSEEEDPEAVAEKAFAKLIKKYEAKQASIKKAGNKLQSLAHDYLKAQPAVSKLPAFTGNGATSKTQKIEVGDDRRFVGKSAKDLALTVKMMYSQIPEYQREHMTLGEVVRDESFLNHLKAKIGYALEANPLGADDAIAMKSVAPFIRKSMKAEELMATDIAGQGQEWVSIFYVAESWREAEEDNQLYNLLSSRGMQVKNVPRGVNQVEFKTTDRGAEMYTRGEPNSLDATNRPESTVNYSTPVTGKITKTLKEHAIAVAYSHRLDLQSLLDVAQEVNWDIDQALGEGLEFVLLNGDTETGASANINLIDGTPATGLATPKYIAFDGLRKEPLITVAAQSRSAGGALTSADYLNTHKLFPNKIQARIQNHLFVIDSQTKNKTRTLTDIKTKDVAGDENTLFTGRIPDLFDIPVYTSSQLALANTSGLVSATAGNNLYGSILDIYAPYCAYGRQQDIMVETARDIDSGATKFVANIYHVFMTRAANSVMMTYYVGA